MPDRCPCEKDVAVLKAQVHEINKDLKGNGQEGVLSRFIKIEKEVSEMTNSIDKIATAYSALAKAQDTQAALDHQKEKNRKARSSAIQRVGTIFAIIFGLVSTLYIILNHIG